MQKVERLKQWALQFPNSYLNSNINLEYLPGFGLSGVAINNSDGTGENDWIKIDLCISLNYLSAYSVEHGNLAFAQSFENGLQQLLAQKKPAKKSTKKNSGDSSFSLQALLLPSTGYEGSVHHHNNDMFDVNAILFYCFLIYERHVRGEQSFWFPYLDSLPTEFDTPLYYSDSELDELKGSNLLKSVLSIKQRLVHIFEHIVRPLTQMDTQTLFPKEAFTLQNFVWAYSVVWSRVFPIQFVDRDGQKRVLPTLLPLIDILNHNAGENVTYLTNEENNTFSLRSSEPLQTGQQVFNNYGGKSNDSFLLSYGFVVENNSQDTLYMQLGLAGDEDQIEFKNKLLNQHGLKLGYYLKNDHFMPAELFKALKICLLDDEEIYHFRNEQIESDVSFRNGMQLLGIKKQFRQMLLNFETTLDHDAHLLSNLRSKPELTRHERHLIDILIYRMGQKQILQSTLNIVLQMENDYIQRVHEQLPQDISAAGTLCGYNVDVANNWLKMQNNVSNCVLTTREDKQHSVYLQTTNEINVGGDIVVTKLENTITIETIMKSPIGQLVSALFLQQNPDQELFDEETMFMLYLLYSKFSPTSSDYQFQFFVESIPSEFNCLLMYSDEVLEELQDQALIEETLELKAGLQETFDNIVAHLQFINKKYPNNKQFEAACHLNKGSVLTFEHFLWSYVVFDTCVSRIESNNASINDKAYILPTPCIHDTRVQYSPNRRWETWYDGRDGTLHVSAVTPFSAGSMIQTNILAEKPQDELLLRYGVSIAKDDHNRECIRHSYALELDEEIASMIEEDDAKIELSQLLGFSMNPCVHILRNNDKPNRLLNFLRLCFMSNEEAEANLDRLKTNDAYLIGDRQVDLHTTEDNHVKQTARDIIQSVLEQYPTSLEEDYELCSTSENHPSLHNCLNYRILTKEILQSNYSALSS